MRGELELKWIFFLCIGIYVSLSPNNLNAQTWVTTDFWDINSGMNVNHDSTRIGPLEMCKAPNGNILMLVQTDVDQSTNRMMYNVTGTLIANSTLSRSGGIYAERTFGLKPCKDNGSVCIVHHISAPNDYWKVIKIGSISWTKTYNLPDQVLYAIPTCYNTYLVLINDSLVELDSAGQYLRSRINFVENVSALEDSDMVVYGGSTLRKESFTGVIKWSIPLSGVSIISADTANIYCRYGATVNKIRTKDGSIVWSRSISTGKISLTNDSGLITCNGNQIARFDSAGNNMWTRTSTFPMFGFTSIIEDTAGYFVTGGAIPCIYLYRWAYSSANIGYSYFVARIDSNGNGTIDSTDHYFNGNANDNGIVSFTDDAPIIAAAVGNTGPPLISALQSTLPSFISVFGIDWPGQFSSGLNYKFSDADGNGIIDALDYQSLTAGQLLGGFGYAQSHWRTSSTNSNAGIYTSIVEDSINAGDSATIIVHADPFLMIDSIYALAMTVNYYSLFFQVGSVYNLVSNFGDPATNLNIYTNFNSSNGMNFNCMLSRTDHQNATLNGDTLIKFKMATNSSLSGNYYISTELHAVTKDAFDVPLNYFGDSIYLINPTANLSERNFDNISIRPNPSEGRISIELGKSKSGFLRILDSNGNRVEERDFASGSVIDFSNYPDGIFFLSIITDTGTIVKKIAIVH